MKQILRNKDGGTCLVRYKKSFFHAIDGFVYTVKYEHNMIIILIAAFLLIYNFGLEGAAWSVSFSSIVMWIQYVIQYRKTTGSGLKSILVLKKSDFLMIKNLLLALYKKK